METLGVIPYISIYRESYRFAYKYVYLQHKTNPIVFILKPKERKNHHIKYLIFQCIILRVF